jgi:hypothetical protein
VSKRLIWCEVVDSDDVDIWVSKAGTEEVTSDATKTIDSDINHESVLATSGAHEKAQLLVVRKTATTLGA